MDSNRVDDVKSPCRITTTCEHSRPPGDVVVVACESIPLRNRCTVNLRRGSLANYPLYLGPTMLHMRKQPNWPIAA